MKRALKAVIMLFLLLPALSYGADVEDAATDPVLLGTWIFSGGMAPQRLTDCSVVTQEGHVCWDTDDDQQYIGSGGTAVLQTGAAHGNGANCAAGEYPLGVDDSGAVESCTDATTEITTAVQAQDECSEITSCVPNAWDALTDMALNSGQVYIGNVSNNPQARTVSGDATISSTGAINLTADNIDGDDVNSNYAGRSLTETAGSPDTLDADPELYTDVKCIWFEDPVATDDFESIWTANGFAATITKIWCESDQTVNADLQVDDGTPADVNGTDLVCDSTPAEDESMGGDATLADGDRLDLAITSVSGTPTWVSICWTYTKDD